MQCPRGWILAHNEQGFTVPFFVKVRSVDVFYSNSMSEKFAESGVMTQELEALTILPPGQTYMIEMGEWKVILQNNEQVTMQRLIPFSAMTLVDGHLEILIDLPFKISSDDIVETNIIKRCKQKELILSQQNVTYGEPTEKFEILTIQIDTYKSDGSDFIESDLEAEEFQTSMLELTIHAIAQLGKYSHIDDANQIGASWNGVSGSNGTPANAYSRDEIDTIIENLKRQIANGEILKMKSIMDVVDEPSDARVLNSGFILDIEEDITPTQTGVSDTEALNAMAEEDGIQMIDINDLFGGTK